MTYDDKLLVDWFKISQVKKLGPGKLQKLLGIFESPERLVCASDEELRRTRIFSDDMLLEWTKLKGIADSSFLNPILQCRENNIKIVPLFDELYPNNLRTAPSPPKTLFLAGNVSLLKRKKIAIVGTRNPGNGAEHWANEMAKNLTRAGFIIVSGGAKGIDTAAHEGGLENGESVCVFGTGLLHYFPPENKDLFERIKKKGLLISEHLPNFPGSRIAFIQRNRITSGISDALVLVASNTIGGSMVQTKIAFEQRVPIYCPSLSMNILPNEGTKVAISSFAAKEINSYRELISELAKTPSQLKLVS